MIEANNPKLESWVDVPAGSDFPIQNLPFGVFKTDQLSPRVGVAIGEQVLDLKALSILGYMENLPFSTETFASDSLNNLMAHGKQSVRELRNRISKLLSKNFSDLRDHETHAKQVLFAQTDVQMIMPVKVGDYTDFYSSEQHAYNVGCMFRDPDNALLPNWKHIPVGYHGRASSIILSGQDVHRPMGQTFADGADAPSFGPSRLVDFELEMAFITFDGKPLGQRISTAEAEEFIFGMALFNDWSARDIQKWEYVPLGPFLAKNFASSMSPWIVTLDALEPFRVPGPVQEPKVLPYLEYEGDKHLAINLEVAIQPEGGEENVVSNSNYKHMYWNMNQQLAHHTVNGCDIHAGDMMASGTISGSDEGSFGSMLEISWKGTKPVKLKDGTERKFIQDNDYVIMRGHCFDGTTRVGFGEVKTKLLPALDME